MSTRVTGRCDFETARPMAMAPMEGGIVPMHVQIFQGLVPQVASQATSLENILRTLCQKIETLETCLTSINSGVVEMDMRLKTIAHNIEGGTNDDGFSAMSPFMPPLVTEKAQQPAKSAVVSHVISALAMGHIAKPLERLKKKRKKATLQTPPVDAAGYGAGLASGAPVLTDKPIATLNRGHSSARLLRDSPRSRSIPEQREMPHSARSKSIVRSLAFEQHAEGVAAPLVPNTVPSTPVTEEVPKESEHEVDEPVVLVHADPWDMGDPPAATTGPRPTDASKESTDGLASASSNGASTVLVAAHVKHDEAVANASSIQAPATPKLSVEVTDDDEDVDEKQIGPSEEDVQRLKQAGQHGWHVVRTKLATLKRPKNILFTKKKQLFTIANRLELLERKSKELFAGEKQLGKAVDDKADSHVVLAFSHRIQALEQAVRAANADFIDRLSVMATQRKDIVEPATPEHDPDALHRDVVHNSLTKKVNIGQFATKVDPTRRALWVDPGVALALLHFESSHSTHAAAGRRVASSLKLNIFPVLVAESDPPQSIAMLPYFDLQSCLQHPNEAVDAAAWDSLVCCPLRRFPNGGLRRVQRASAPDAVASGTACSARRHLVGRIWQNAFVPDAAERGPTARWTDLRLARAAADPPAVGVCLNDVSAAMASNVGFVPLMVRPCEIPLSICRIQWLDLSDCLVVNTQNNTSTVNDVKYAVRMPQLVTALRGNLDHDGQQARLFRCDVDDCPPPLPLTPRQREPDVLGDGYKVLSPRASERNDADDGRGAGQIGTGKTALAAYIIQSQPEVRAFHLVSKDDEQTQNPRRCILSLAYQLTTQLPAYAAFLQQGEPLEEIVAVSSVTELVTTLLVVPLNAIAQPTTVPLVILLDGLDAFQDALDNCFVSSLVALVRKLPSWVRMIWTSREDPSVMRKLQGCRESNMAGIIQCLLQRLTLDKLESFPVGMGGYLRQFFEDQFSAHHYETSIRPLLEVLCAALEPMPMAMLHDVMKWDVRAGARGLPDDIKPFHTSVFEWLQDANAAGRFFNGTPGAFLIRYSAKHKLYCASFVDKVVDGLPQIKHNIIYHLDSVNRARAGDP
ncbi:hypothetical protein DYB32_002632 [Aphanomyces invadans]|uniref:Nephrocystin 3-like N-terminal domain-containing protein n=1 Tax=Aphanomyces invadans TaxID=157072 RepID=A0A3R6Z7I6_9STRA|nr:hypothetical protein DYB32_002632 [Aphanomyces invadans]